MKTSIEQQITEVNRELALRRNVYASRVAGGKMRQAEADLCMARMEAVLATLVFCRDHAETIRAAHAASAGSAEQQ